MKKLIIGLFLLIFLLGCSNDPIYSTENNIYILDIYLDAESDSLKVEGELDFRNDNYDLDELYITLYPNADNPSTRDYNVDFQYLRIEEIDSDYEIRGADNTQIYIELDETLKKGERISIQFEYEFNYWDHGRLAEYGDYYITMFFYPFVAMYDDEGWNIDPFTFRGESYYNEIGDYYVTLNTPNSYEVATGAELISKGDEGSRQIAEYEIKNARDFSFSASPNYHIYEHEVSGRTYQIYSLNELTSTELIESKEALANTFDFFESQIGDYPYNHFTLEYGNYYGMESTGVIYCSSEINIGTVVHEVIHQWFYSMVGNDQSDESFLDEAVTTYMESLYYYSLYGMEGYNGQLDYRSSLQERFDERYLNSLGDSLLQKVDEFGELYAYKIYYHGPSMFRYYVEEFLEGDNEKFYDIISKYFEEYKFKIATLDNLLDLIESESGIDNTKEWFMMQITEFQDFDNRP
ncbi:M1 family aminopeptidase [Mycoplasmatota bacterium WC30]